MANNKSLELEELEAFQSFFQAPSFSGMVLDIIAAYKQFGFTDDIDDRTRMEEFKYITEQFRKFIFKKQAELSKYWDKKELLLNKLESIVSKQYELETERKKFIYNFFRDEWLVNLTNFIRLLIESEDGNDGGYR